MPDFESLAAEYALGLLDGQERSAFEAMLRRDPAAASALADWQARFAAMAEAEVEAVAPPARIETAIEAALFSEAGRPASIWDRVAFWRGVSALSSAVAVAAIGFALLPLVNPPGPVGPSTSPPDAAIPPGTILMTHLLPVEGSGLGLALFRQPNGTLQVRRVAGGPTPGRAQQVWLVLGDDTPPISLGLLGDEPQTTLDPAPEIAARFGVGAAVAISDEPAGGSPTGAPTGPILAVGELVAL